jgi:peptidyl-prolyl cis-trans isomerase SurA
MKTCRHSGFLVAIAPILVCLTGIAQQSQNGAHAPAQGGSETPIVLDRVIAIVNGDVLLESDVREEMRVAVLQPISIAAGQNTESDAVQRLIRRALILQQMRAQQAINYSVSDEEVQKSLKELRAEIPICRQIGCSTEEGWKAFLKANDLTEKQAEDRWRQRLEILKFINIRFGAGIRISRQDIQKYYQSNVVRSFEKLKEKPPSVESVSARIQEILLQQQVNSMLRDWLQSLRDQGTVQILDPRFGKNTNSDEGEEGGA